MKGRRLSDKELKSHEAKRDIWKEVLDGIDEIKAGGGKRYTVAPSTEVAKARLKTGLSQSQFDRSFRRVFGTSARQYLLRVRVEAACRKLAETEETVAALAAELGFFDHAHFTRCFRSLMGLTPAQYRKQRVPKGKVRPVGRARAR